MANVVSQSIKNLKGGISQQPHMLRYPEQGTTQINGWSSEVAGLQKRPPLLLTRRLGDAGSIGVAPQIHMINRDKVERYYAVFTGTGIKVYDLDGVEKTVAIAAGSESYITTPTPREDIRCITVADYTFVINKKKKVATGTAVTDGGTFTGNDITHDCIIVVRGQQYGRTITITVNGKTVANTAPSGTGTNQDEVAKMPALTDAQVVINDLVTKLKAAANGWQVDAGTGFIYIKTPQAEPITELRVADGYANQLAYAITHQVTTVAKLPIEAPNHYKVEITGDTTKTGDRYYVQYDALNKVWKETIGWNLVKGLDASTMPHALIRKADGSFSFQALDGSNGFASWDERKVGDDDTNPMPSFIDESFNDIFMFRNRLGLLAGENIILSKTAKYFDFFPSSVANDSDDDPIDVAISHNRVSILKYAVPFAEQLLLWSDQAQFVLAAQGVLSAKTIELNLATQFDVSDFARPFGIGRAVFFAAPRSSYTSIMRYYSVEDVSDVKNAENMTAHVPYYIPNGVFNIYGSSTENFVTVLSASAQNKVYIYKFLYSNEQLVQQSWSHWDFGEHAKVFAANTINSKMYVIMETGYDLIFCTLSLSQQTNDFDKELYRYYIDYKKEFTIPTGVYDIATNKTTLYPFNMMGSIKFGKDLDFIAVRDDGFVHRFVCPSTEWNEHADVSLDGNYEGRTFVIGFAYEFLYTFSQFLIKKQADDGTMTSEDVGRLQLRRAWVNYQDTGAFTVTVIAGNRNPFIYKMSGPVLNGQKMVIGQMTLPTGQFKFPCQGKATEVEVSITSDNPTPLEVIGCGWEGVHIRKSSGI